MYEGLEIGYSLIDFVRIAVTTIRYKPDLYYERYNLFAPAGIWAKKLFGVPLILEINAPLLLERSQYGGIALRSLASWSERFVWRNADMCLPVTASLARFVEDVGVAADRIMVIPNGVDLGEFAVSRPASEVRRQLFGDRKPFVLGFVGFVRSWHGLDQIVDLMCAPELAPFDPVLLVVGDGPARAELEQQAARLGLSNRIVFTGIVQREGVKDFVSIFDIALQPNVVGYASPLKLFEYLALGRAIVAPRTPNIEEVLSHEHNALLFSVGDSDELRRAVLCLATTPSLRARLQAAAAATIRAGNYTWQANAARIERVGNRILEGKLSASDRTTE